MRCGARPNAAAAPATVGGEQAAEGHWGDVPGKAGRLRLIREPGDLPSRRAARAGRGWIAMPGGVPRRRRCPRTPTFGACPAGGRHPVRPRLGVGHDRTASRAACLHRLPCRRGVRRGRAGAGPAAVRRGGRAARRRGAGRAAAGDVSWQLRTGVQRGRGRGRQVDLPARAHRAGARRRPRGLWRGLRRFGQRHGLALTAARPRCATRSWRECPATCSARERRREDTGDHRHRLPRRGKTTLLRI